MWMSVELTDEMFNQKSESNPMRWIAPVFVLKSGLF